MDATQDRRRWPRKRYNEPLLGILHLACVLQHNVESCDDETHLFVDILNTCPTGAQIDAPAKLTPGSMVTFLFLEPDSAEWRNLHTRVVWSRPHPDDGLHRSGLEFLSEQPCDRGDGFWSFEHVRPLPGDLDSLLGSKLLAAVPKPAAYRLLNCLQRKRAAAGEEIIRQGETGDSMYILHSGSCLVQVESRGERHVLARLGPGDIVGEMSVLTGEPRMASVAAETDLQYWELPKDKFDAVAGKHPDLRLFLTEVVTQRFENSPITAERSIGKYVVERKIGKGGWSIVYAGRHKRLGLHVVVKMLKHDMAMEPSFLDTFGKEAEIIAQLNHPNIVKVYDIEELYRTVFIIMEHLDGLALSSILERYGVVSIPRTVNFLSQMLHGLAYAHKQGVMHRDMKPANIFVQPKDRIKILDFGLACQPGVEDHSIAGTAHYAPPEQIEGDPVDERADLYSMGIMAYEMLLGRRPYPEDDLARLMDLHVEEDIPDPAADMPDMPPVLREFIITCCRRPPDGRYASAWEALDAIRPLVRELGLLGRQEAPRRREIASMLMFYNQEQRPEVDELVEQFKRMAQNLGLDMRRADFREH